MTRYCFTSESVSEGHPDKMCDQISDAILDAILAKDKNARVACETLVKTGMVVLAGEITTNTWVDLEELTREVIKQIGYDSGDIGFDGNSCAILNCIGKQSADIGVGVDSSKNKQLGAGDQGLVFGYACDETEVLMPTPIIYCHRIMQKQAQVRKNKSLPWLRADAKCQLTFIYENGVPISIDTIVFSTHHRPDVSQNTIKELVVEEIIKPVLGSKWMNSNVKLHINPTGSFVIGGPLSDCGLTGRKIIVDTYGGMARHGGGAFSGKDPTKVDRSAAYAARYVAKNLVASGLAKKCEVQISYAIGVSAPTSVYVDSFGTSKLPEEELANLVLDNFDLTPQGIIDMLDLQRPIFRKTACYGHFGRELEEFNWEKTDKASKLKN